MSAGTPQTKQAGTGPSVSIVVVSRGRGESLTTCLCGLTRLLYAPYEIIVVSDAEGAAAVQAAGLIGLVKLVRFEEANISKARNLGIAEAAGEVIAFIDDDAVAEPTWLHHLVAGFDLPDVSAVGGYVRGRNGISYQWKARSVDDTGKAHDLSVRGDHPRVVNAPDGQAVKTEGTNMAFRADVLKRIGGFDEVFAFYLDETDLNLRLHQAGHVTAIAPLAEVHHAYAPSPRRRQNRAVTDLRDVGASTAVFLNKHCPEPYRAGAIADMRQEQIRRIWRQRRAGLLNNDEVQALTRGLEEGFADGEARRFGQYARFATAPAFLPFETRARGEHRVLAGRIWQRQRLISEAEALTAAGHTVSLFLFSPTLRRHRMRFVLPGYWLQQGGIWGRSRRDRLPFSSLTFRARLMKEQKRLSGRLYAKN